LPECRDLVTLFKNKKDPGLICSGNAENNVNKVKTLSASEIPFLRINIFLLLFLSSLQPICIFSHSQYCSSRAGFYILRFEITEW
jgi:hypothetical protein